MCPHACVCRFLPTAGPRDAGKGLGGSLAATSLTGSVTIAERSAHPANTEGDLEGSGCDGGAPEK